MAVPGSETEEASGASEGDTDFQRPLQRGRTSLQVSGPVLSKREAKVTCKYGFTPWLLEFK